MAKEAPKTAMVVLKNLAGSARVLYDAKGRAKRIPAGQASDPIELKTAVIEKLKEAQLSGKSSLFVFQEGEDHTVEVHVTKGGRPRLRIPPIPPKDTKKPEADKGKADDKKKADAKPEDKKKSVGKPNPASDLLAKSNDMDYHQLLTEATAILPEGRIKGRPGDVELVRLLQEYAAELESGKEVKPSTGKDEKEDEKDADDKDDGEDDE